MRAVECDIPNCAHMHAPDDDELVRVTLRHAHEVHPEDPFDEEDAREFVRAGGYDDTEHE
jgi:predicted small metal-binding protein